MKSSVRVLLLSLALSMWFVPAAAQSEQNAERQLFCTARHVLLSALYSRHKLIVRSAGPTSGGMLAEFLSTDTGSAWAMIMTTPRKVSCLLLFGENWTYRTSPPKEPT